MTTSPLVCSPPPDAWYTVVYGGCLRCTINHYLTNHHRQSIPTQRCQEQTVPQCQPCKHRYPSHPLFPPTTTSPCLGILQFTMFSCHLQDTRTCNYWLSTTRDILTYQGIRTLCIFLIKAICKGNAVTDFSSFISQLLFWFPLSVLTREREPRERGTS